MAERIELVISAKDVTARAFSSVNARVSKLTRKVGGFLRTAAPVGGLLSGAGVIAFTKKSVDSAERQANAVRGLSAALGEGSEDIVSALVAQADALQVVTGRSNDAIIAAQALLVNFGATPDRMDAATRATLDLAAAFGQDLTQAARNIGRTFGGLTGELGEVLPALAALTKEELQNGAAVDLILDLYGGRARTAFSAFTISTKQVGNAFDDLLKRLGRNVIQSETFVAAMIGIREQLERTFTNPKQIEESQKKFDAFILSVLLGSAATIDATIAVSEAVIGFAGDVKRGFQSLPDVIQKFGFLGAVFFGKKGLATFAAISFALGKATDEISAFEAINAGRLTFGEIFADPEKAKAKLREIVAANIAAAERVLGKFEETQNKLTAREKDVLGQRLRAAEDGARDEIAIEQRLRDANLGIIEQFGDDALDRLGAARSRVGELSRILETELRGIVSDALSQASEDVSTKPFSNFLEAALADKKRLLALAREQLDAPVTPGVAPTVGGGDPAARAAALREIQLRRQINNELLSEEKQGIAARSAAIQTEFENRLLSLAGNSEAQIAAVKARNKKMEALVKEGAGGQGDFLRLLKTTGVDAAKAFGDNFSSAFSDFILGTKSAKEAFKQFAADFLAQIARMIVQALVLFAIEQALGALFGGTAKAKPSGGNGTIQGFSQSVASGGIATRPTLAIIGDNPSQKEAIIPLDDPRAMALLGGAGGGAQFSFSTQVVFQGGAVQTDVTGTGRREAAEQAAQQFNNMAQAWAIDNMRPGGVFSGFRKG